MTEKLPWFPFFPADWLNDEKVSELPLEVQGAYLRLLCQAWINGGFLPKNLENLSKICGISRTIFRKFWEKNSLKNFFFLTDDGERLYNPRLSKEVENQMVKSRTARESAQARWRKVDANASETHAKRICGIDAIQNQSQNKSKSSRNNTSGGQFPVKTDPDEFVLAPASGKPERKPAALQMPVKDISETPEEYHVRYLAWAKEKAGMILEKNRQIWTEAYPAVSIDNEIKRAIGWLAGKPKKRKKDISGFLTNWLSEQQDRGGRKPKQYQGGFVVDNDAVRDEAIRLHEERMARLNNESK